MLHKKKPLTIKIKQGHITNVSLLLNTAIKGIFKQLSTYVNRVQYTVVKASSLEGALCIKYIKFSTSRVTSRAFGACDSGGTV